MSTTKNGIYYPNDYDSVADIPADMKKLAESVDTKISNNKSDITNIKTEQTTQNTNISNLQEDNTINKTDITNIKAKDTEQDKYISELEAENARLRQDLNGLPKGQASGESIDLNDSAEMRCDLKISGNSKQETRSGKNKLKITSFVDRTTDGVTFTAKFDIKGNLQYINAVGNSTTGYRDIIIVDISNLPAGNYKINGLGADKVIRYVLLKANDTEPKAITTNTDVTFTQDSSSPYVRFRIDLYQAGEIDCQIKPMIRLSSETDNTYEPYGAMPSPDYPSENESCGDNGSINEVICNRNELSSEWEQGAINTDTGVGYDANNSIRTKDFIRVLPNVEYYISRTIATYYNSYFFYDINKNFLGRHNAEGMITTNLTTKNMQSNDYNQVITINNSQVAYMKIFDISNDLNTRYLLQRNSVIDKTYIEHQSQIFTIPTQQPMRSVGDIRDTFIKKNNKWYERHYVSRKIFDGTEDWKLSQDSDFYTKKYNDIIKASSKVICNYFPNIVGFTGQNTVFIGDTSAIGITNTNYTNVSDFTAWLLERYNAGKPVYIDCLLKTPLDIECTEEQSTILWDIEQNAKTYDKVTHMYSTDKISSYKEVTYKKDIETLFENTLVEGV